MPAGFQVFDANGNLQVSSEMMTYHLRKTGQKATQSRNGGNTTASSLLVEKWPGSDEAICAVRPPNGYSASLIGQAYSRTNWNFATDAPIGTVFDYFIFDRSVHIPGSNFGIEVRNGSGEITYSTNHRPMSAVAMLGSQSVQMEYYNDPPSVSLPGRSLAFFNMAFAGHSQATGVWCSRRNGLEVPDPNLDDGGPCDAYSWHNDGKVYGGRLLDGGSRVESAQISFDDVFVSNSDYPTNEYVIPMKLFVVDVTHAPIGVQFF
jgi:hypothetical protein